ncbi:MAG: PHP domain-containing protein, partial [Calditrichaeota bacterium]
MSFQINMPKTRDYSQKIVKQEQIVYLRDAGYKVMDLHLHTSVSYDVIPSFQVVPRNLYSNMEKKGFDFITFTDHDTMLAYDDFPEMPANLIPGVEIKIQPKRVGRYEECHTLHINVYTLNQNQLQDLQYIASKREFYEFKAYLEASDLPYQLNHPTWCELTDKPDWHYLPDIIKEFDVIEACNYKRSTWHNHITL